MAPRDLRALSLPDQSAALQVMGSPVPIRTLNKSDITGVRLQALAIAAQVATHREELLTLAEEYVVWALRPATEAEEAAASAS